MNQEKKEEEEKVIISALEKIFIKTEIMKILKRMFCVTHISN